MNVVLLSYSGEHSSEKTTNFVFKFKSEEFTELMVDHGQLTFELSGKNEQQNYLPTLHLFRMNCKKLIVELK